MRILALLLALTAAAGWGVGGILIKKGTDAVTPVTILAFQYAIGLVVVAGWVLAAGDTTEALAGMGRHWPLLLTISLLQVGAYIAFVVALTHTGAGSLATSAVIAIAASYPALAAVLSSPVLGETLHWNDALGVALVVSGVIVSQAF